MLDSSTYFGPVRFGITKPPEPLSAMGGWVLVEMPGADGGCGSLIAGPGPPVVGIVGIVTGGFTPG